MENDELPDRSGQVLKAKYRLEQRLGIGGMAEVYRACNLMVERTVAIKLLHQELASNRQVVDRFLREARAANFVRHPNVVEVLDIDTDENGAPFIVQEYLQGEDLACRLEKAGANLPVQTAVRMLLPVIKAIGVAHEKGLIHRDLKPENIYLASQRGTVVPKVLDFGISKMPLAKGSSSLTITGTVMGSPAYMSPEQIQNSQSVDPRTDVWSLGVILYKALSGQLPYSAESPTALFVKICTTDPKPLERARPGLPAELNTAVSRCLKRDPAERFKDANELYTSISQVMEAGGTIAKAPLPAAKPPSPTAASPAPSPEPRAARVPEPARPEAAIAPQPVQPEGSPAERAASANSAGAGSAWQWGEIDTLGKGAVASPKKPAAKPEITLDRSSLAFAGDDAPRKGKPKTRKERQLSSKRERAAGAQRSTKQRPGGRAQTLGIQRPAPANRASPVNRLAPVHRMAVESQSGSFDRSVLANTVMAALLVIGVSFLVRHIGPSDQDSVQSEIGSRSIVPMIIATGLLLFGSVQLAVQAMRVSSLGLLIADVGLFAVTGCAAVAAWSMYDPEAAASVLPTTTSAVTWAGAAVPLGLAWYGLTKAREGFKAENTSRLAEAIVILVLSIGALVASVNLGVKAMQGGELPLVDMDVESFNPGPGVINIE